MNNKQYMQDTRSTIGGWSLSKTKLLNTQLTLANYIEF